MFFSISNKTITKSLEETSRQYLAGNLSRPQLIEYFSTKDLEVGISKYQKDTSEKVHTHSVATEFQLVLSGMTQYIDIDSGEVFTYRKGDFYVITPGTSYGQRSKSGTEILFIKTPSINDKMLVEPSLEYQEWLEGKISSKRTDYYYSPDAPKANSICPAAAVAVIDDSKVLMIKRRDNGMWSLPGGTQEFGESLHDCAIRELKEETGISVDIYGVVGTYTDPNVKIEYSDGEVRQEFTIVYIARLENENNIRLDSESTEYRWIALDEASELKMANSQRKRINDLQEYIQDNMTRIR